MCCYFDNFLISNNYKVACEKICSGVFVLLLWSCIWFCTSLATYDLVQSIEEDYLYFLVS